MANAIYHEYSFDEYHIAFLAFAPQFEIKHYYGEVSNIKMSPVYFVILRIVIWQILTKYYLHADKYHLNKKQNVR